MYVLKRNHVLFVKCVRLLQGVQTLLDSKVLGNAGAVKEPPSNGTSVNRVIP